MSVVLCLLSICLTSVVLRLWPRVRCCVCGLLFVVVSCGLVSGLVFVDMSVVLCLLSYVSSWLWFRVLCS